MRQAPHRSGLAAGTRSPCRRWSERQISDALFVVSLGAPLRRRSPSSSGSEECYVAPEREARSNTLAGGLKRAAARGRATDGLAPPPNKQRNAPRHGDFSRTSPTSLLAPSAPP